MRLDFKILWFDDQSIDGHKRVIDEILMRNYCLKLVVSNKKGNEDLSKTNYDKFDLVLMDYGLIGSESGVEKFKSIREAHSYVDVALYSTTMQKFREDLKRLEESGIDIEGAYYLDYQNDTLFEEKIEKIIDKIVKRSESIENLRGLILSETAAFDKRVYELIVRLTKEYNLEQEIDNYISSNLHRNMVKSYEEKEKYYNESENKFEYCMDPSRSIPYLDASNQTRLLNKIIKLIKGKGKPIDDRLNNFYDNYLNEVIHYRNAFAHNRQKENTIRVKDKEIVLDEAFHKSMRETLNKYDELFLLIEQL